MARNFQLIDMMPDHNLAEDATGDYEAFIDEVLQPVLDIAFQEVDRFKTVNDPDNAPEVVLDAMLNDLGDPFTSFSQNLSVEKKRRLVKLLLYIYKQKGTEQSIIGAIRFFFDVDATISNDLQTLDVYGWKLGFNALAGENEVVDEDKTDLAVIGTGEDVINSGFQVDTTPTLNAEQKIDAEKIIDKVKPVNTILIGFKTTAIVADVWDIGISELGDNTELEEV